MKKPSQLFDTPQATGFDRVTHNTREEEVLAEFDERFVTALSTEYKTRIRDWIKYTFHQELQKARMETVRRLNVYLKHDLQCAVEWDDGDCDCGLKEIVISATQSELDQPSPWQCGKCKQEQIGKGEEIPEHHHSCEKRAELDQPK